MLKYDVNSQIEVDLIFQEVTFTFDSQYINYCKSWLDLIRIVFSKYDGPL